MKTSLRAIAVSTALVLAAAGPLTVVGPGAAGAEHSSAGSATGSDPAEAARVAADPPEPTTGRDGRALRLQNDFDHIVAEVHALEHGSRTSYYIDEGDAGDRAVVFLGGQGTSLEAFQLTEFARTTRERLGLRVISVERNGFGESGYDASLGYADYVDEVLAVLDHLDVDRFVVVTISGGGAYANHLAARVPERVISFHAAAAAPFTLPTRTAPTGCERTTAQRNAANERWTHRPKDWWAVPGSPVLAVPGWQARAYTDAVRAFYLGGRLGDASALSHESALPCGRDAVAGTARITAPAYLYWGGEDEVVPVAAMRQWERALPNVARATLYPGEGHTVQYRHWDQILADMAGYADHTVVCRGGQTSLMPQKSADRALRRGATLGLCAWTSTDR